MAMITENMLKLDTKKNRIDLACPKFLSDLCKKDDLLEIGQFNISVQLVLDGLDKIDPKLEKTIGQETAKVYDAAAVRMGKLITKLREEVQKKQADDKKGDDKAGKEASDIVKKLSDEIASEMNAMGGAVRKHIEGVLKKKGLKPKIKSVSRNQWKKVKVQAKAFKSSVGSDVDGKTMSSLENRIDDIAFPKGHKLVEEYISQANAITDAIKGLSRGGDAKELRSDLDDFSKTIDTFQKELNQGKELAKATIELKKQKGAADKNTKILMKGLADLEKYRQQFAGELKENSSLISTALKYVDAGKNDALPSLASKFQSAAKEMGSLSSKTSPIAKEIVKQAKQSAK